MYIYKFQMLHTEIHVTRKQTKICRGYLHNKKKLGFTYKF
jgi:hypothetical protein